VMELRALGVVLSINVNGRLAYDAPEGVVTDSILAQVREHRDELLAVVERIEERAAIMEHDGGMSRAEAERLAIEDVVLCSSRLEKTTSAFEA